MEETVAGVEVEVVLRRRLQHHLLTTFLPTLCLMLVCQSGLYLRCPELQLHRSTPRAEHFKTTAAISVTVMLVMYTLYQVTTAASLLFINTLLQAVSNRLTPTAYIKLIDIWLIFGLLLPFVVFFLLVSIDHLPSAPTASTKALQLWRVRRALSTFARIGLPLIILLFVTCYAITAAVIYIS